MYYAFVLQATAWLGRGKEVICPENLASGWWHQCRKHDSGQVYRNCHQMVCGATMQADGPPWNSLNGTDPYRQAWSPDGRFLAFTTSITSNDYSVPGPVQIFRPGAIDWKGALCAIAGTDLTDTEWKANADTSLARPHLCS